MMRFFISVGSMTPFMHRHVDAEALGEAGAAIVEAELPTS